MSAAASAIDVDGGLPPRALAPLVALDGGPDACSPGPRLLSYRHALALLRAGCPRSGEQLAFPLWWLGPTTPTDLVLSREEMVAERIRQWDEQEAARLADVRSRRRARRQLRFRWPRKCSALPRARSISGHRLTREERQAATDPDLFPTGWDADRPLTRGDCEGQPRPCPWVSCRYNLYLDVADNGTTIKFNFPDREPGDMPPTGSCALDVADRVAAGEAICLGDIGAMTNRSIERIRQVSARALQEMRVKSMWGDQHRRLRLRVVTG